MRTRVLFMFLLCCLLPAAAALAGGFVLTSPQLKEGGRIAMEQVFHGFGCQGGDVSPALHWQGAPAGTKSFAVTVYDPDAPTGSGWWHWVIFNIPAGVHSLAKGAGNPRSGLAPQGSVQSRTDYGRLGYGGPCPPKGDKAHRYLFTVYALKTAKLPLDASASGAMVGFYLHQEMLGKAVLKGYYGR